MNIWKYDSRYKCLELTIKPGYEVYLDRCTTSAQVLDWIMQIGKKTWATKEIIADLVLKLDEILDIQGNLCSMGVDHFFDAIEYLKKTS